MEEKTFFSQQDVIVTNARFMAGGQTFAMSGITSVKHLRNEPSRLLSWAFGIVGVFCLLSRTEGGVVFALIFLAIAAVIWRSQKPTFSVVLNTASGEMKAYTSADKDQIARVVSALNESIVHRG
jgi:hypothetical protein